VKVRLTKTLNYKGHLRLPEGLVLEVYRVHANGTWCWLPDNRRVLLWHIECEEYEGEIVAVTCKGCGQTWKHDPAYDVECPVCNAPVGSLCRHPNGHTAATPHAERDAAAVDTGVLKSCPAAPVQLDLAEMAAKREEDC